MLQALQRNAALLVLLVVALFIFFRMTLPAMERHDVLAKRVDVEARTLHRLEEEAARYGVLEKSLIERDPTVFERAVLEKFVLLPAPERK